MDLRLICSVCLSALAGLAPMVTNQGNERSAGYYAAEVDTNPFNNVDVPEGVPRPTAEGQPAETPQEVLTSMPTSDLETLLSDLNFAVDNAKDVRDDLAEVAEDLKSAVSDYEAAREQFVSDIKAVKDESSGPGFKLDTEKDASASGTRECQCMTPDEFRTLVREELDRRMVMKNVGNGYEVSPSMAAPPPLAVPMHSTSSGNSNGGSVSMMSTPISYSVPSYAGNSDGGSMSMAYQTSVPTPMQASPVRQTTKSTFRTPIRDAFSRAGSQNRYSSGSQSRYFVNEYGCTVDRQTRKVVSCPAQ